MARMVLFDSGYFRRVLRHLGNAFDVEEAKEFFLNMVNNQQSIVLKLNTKFLEPIKEGTT